MSQPVITNNFVWIISQFWTLGCPPSVHSELFIAYVIIKHLPPEQKNG